MLSLVPVSRVLKPGCSHLKHCRQELLPCSTTYCLCVSDSHSSVELPLDVRLLPEGCRMKWERWE